MAYSALVWTLLYLAYNVCQINDFYDILGTEHLNTANLLFIFIKYSSFYLKAKKSVYFQIAPTLVSVWLYSKGLLQKSIH